MATEGAVAVNHILEGPEDAPVLVLSNSLGTTLEMWDAQAPTLRERFRLLRYDGRGHGGSPAPPGPYEIGDLGRDVLALLDTLGIERFSFCGLSLGGMVGMWLASEVPERFERLVLCCTSALFGPPDTYGTRARKVRAEGVGSIAGAVLERWFTPPFRARRPEVVEWAAGMLRGTPAEGYAGCCEAIRDMNLAGRLGSIRAPTLVIAGADDPATPPASHAVPIRDAIPDARLLVVPQAAHLGNVEQPEAFTRAMLDHLGPVSKDGLVSNPTSDNGMLVRREVLGDAHVDRVISGTTPFTADFQDLITRYAWGEIWTRPGLDRKTRSCITLTALVALGHLEELKMHVRAALRNGLTQDEIKEVLLQSAIYCGVPAANAAFAAAQSVLADLDAGSHGSQRGEHE
jgi:3-oxoadipate enol-lactonase/4-carboxymuconolactone decarboxylase